MQAFLAILDRPNEPAIELKRGLPVTIGRSRTCGVRIDDGAVSRRHATVAWDGGATIVVSDHGSHNGTYVDGARIEGASTVGSGSEIVVAGHRIVAFVRRPRGEHPSGTFSTEVIAHDPSMVRVVALSQRAARIATNVLIIGETGSGKEIVARLVHAGGPRAGGRFVPVNCSAVPPAMAESLFFGHEKGAFTDARQAKAGLFEAAHGGTLFLDEIGELDAHVQAKLLRAIESRTVTRLGGTTPIAVDVRIVAATHADLASLVEAGRFREDLRYRLDVIRIEVPALRDRREDILPLAEHFLEAVSRERELRLAEDARARLTAHVWPGNVRELRNVIERAAALADGTLVRARDLEGLTAPATNDDRALSTRVENIERDAIVAALDASGGNQSLAARRLGITRRKLIYKLEKYGLKPKPTRKN
jgi:DNA-binding NtrC family response regulator